MPSVYLLPPVDRRIQEQQEEIEALKAENAKLKTKIAKIAKRTRKKRYTYTVLFRATIDPSVEVRSFHHRGDPIEVQYIKARNINAALRKAMQMQDEFKGYVEVMVGRGKCYEPCFGGICGTTIYWRTCAEGNKRRRWLRQPHSEWGYRDWVYYPLRKKNK
tara:strand:- start:14 stop:496 length:483 start_codon:yes stop_codon:yes gene_type:complete